MSQAGGAVDFDTAWNSADPDDTSTATAPTDASSGSRSVDRQVDDAFRDDPAPTAQAGETDTAPTAANIAEAQSPDAISREDGAVWIGNAGSSGRWFKDGRFVAGERPANAPLRAVSSVTPATADAAALPPGDEFWFPNNGQRIAIPEAFVDRETGDLTIKASQVHELRETLAEAARMADWPERERQYEERYQTAVTAEREYADGWKGIASQLFDILSNPDRIASHLENFDRETDLLLRQLKERAPRQREEPQEPSYSPEQMEHAARTALQEEVDLLLETPDARRTFTTEDERAEIRETFQARLRAYFDHRGKDVMLNQSAVQREFERELKRVQRYRQGASQPTPRPTPKVPSTVPATGTPPAPKPVDKVKWAKDHGFA